MERRQHVIRTRVGSRVRLSQVSFLRPVSHRPKPSSSGQSAHDELAGMGVRTMEDLAEQSVDDLLEIEGMDEERAGQLIMTARAPWFEDQA